MTIPRQSFTSEVPVQAYQVGGVPEFYTQRVTAEGFSDRRFGQSEPVRTQNEAVYLCNMLLAKRPDVRTAMIKSGARMCIMAHE